MTEPTDFPYAGTLAAKMLGDAIRKRSKRKGGSLRQLGRALGYKQPVVLSHMASGRTPIPVDRSTALAAELELDQRTFIIAVLSQRFKSIDWLRLLGPSKAGQIASSFAGHLAGVRLDQLSEEQKKIASELVRDTNPAERWLGIPEVAFVADLRRLRPSFTSQGLSQADVGRILEVLLSS